MQSEPSPTSQTALEEQIPSDQLALSNHGLSIREGGVSLLSAVHSDTSNMPVGLDSTAGGVHGLNNATDTLPPLQSRIEEYENEPSARYSPPMITAARAGKDITPIAAVPNEILTHVLSHLAPVDLASTSLVSRRFNDLVTTPHAWRSAFARYFPGPETLRGSDDNIGDAIVRSERRAFTRLTPKASWRSEYVIRTRMLRSLARGKPGQSNAVTSQSSRNRVVTPEITYGTELWSTINHLHATWSIGPNKSVVRLIHGADDFGMASMSDPTTGRLEQWGARDPLTWGQFADEHPGDALYGLGPGELVAAPNVMDVSQVYGMILGQGAPGGRLHFRHSQHAHGRTAAVADTVADYAEGIPFINQATESFTSVWIAKSSAIAALSGGLIGMLSGASTGVISAYGLNAVGAADDAANRRPQGELTARWVLSPGVPIIGIAVDNEYSLKRQAENRIWAVALNALGEVYYLTKFPRRVQTGDGEEADAWRTARSVYWALAEPSRRVARADPYNEMAVDGSYSPRSSWNGMCLSPGQIRAETLEIQQFLQKRPKDIQKMCHGWDMRRRLEVDFAGDDGHNAGESVVVIECGLEEGSTAAIIRYARRRVHDRGSGSYVSTPSLTVASTPPSASPSLFGSQRVHLAQPTPFSIDGPLSSLEHELDGSMTPRPLVEEWQTARLSFGGLKKVRISTTAIDMSIYATQTQSEDPLLNFADVSAASSPSLGPWSSQTATAADVPGQRARFMAVGTMIGSVLLWNIRESSSRSSDVVSVIEPARVIFTESPQIASLALTSLYVVHGGSDGLVQAWDPLASEMQPIRTLNSRFSSRARRQLVQAQASRRGVGINMYAAGAICLDPDATVLRGAVSLGNRIRFWSYSSSAADSYKSAKRRLRRGERGSNQAGDRIGLLQRTNLKDYIASERFELEREKQERRREADHMAGRFGTELLDGSEEEMIAYASMLSQESHAREITRRSSDSDSAAYSTESMSAISGEKTPTSVGSPLRGPSSKTDEELDADIAEAIRQSLDSAPSTPSYEIAFRPAKSKQKKPISRASPVASPSFVSSQRETELDDYEFAIQLSLAEQASKAALDHDAFPDLDSPSKGKQRQL